MGSKNINYIFTFPFYFVIMKVPNKLNIEKVIFEPISVYLIIILIKYRLCYHIHFWFVIFNLFGDSWSFVFLVRGFGCALFLFFGGGKIY